MGAKIISSFTIATLVALTSSILVIYTVKKRRREQTTPINWKKIGYVRELFIYPLKSGHYKQVDSIECTKYGFRLLKSLSNPMKLRDRSFVIYGENDKQWKSGRTLPTLVKVDVSVHDEATVIFRAPEREPLFVTIPQNEKRANISVPSGEQITVLDCGDEAAKWFSQFISQNNSSYRLAFNNANRKRDLVRHRNELKFYKKMTDASTGLFSDYTSLLILNQASFDDYKKRAPASNVATINFRANIIVQGPQIQAYEEDNWDWMKIGDHVIVRSVKDCTRCVFTTVDQETGQRNLDREPLKTLSMFRISDGPEKLPMMGNHFEVKHEGIIKTGDLIYLGSN